MPLNFLGVRYIPQVHAKHLIIIQYDLRNSSDYTVQNMRTQIFANSFIPSCLSSWNSLPEDLHQAQSIAIFKRSLMSNYFKVEPTPLQYLEGNRKLYCMLTLKMAAEIYHSTNF